MRFQIVLYAVLVCILFPGVTLSEYYQYTDKDGNLHFTDDKAQVPESQRGEIDKFESIEKKPTPSSINARKRSSGSGDRATAPDPNTWDGGLQMRAEQLDAEKEALDKKFEALQKEKAELLGRQSTENMDADSRGAHKARIQELNERIKQYERSCEEFQEKVNQLNARIQQKPEPNSSERE
ncbi:MAG: DUF4124 domain-containing protein [Desulfobacterales bacterium]|nr:DUF4124 domain-containing protein [Desulfobacterales bacterium]